MELETVSRLWPLLLALVTVIIWCIRLEAEVRYLRKDHEEHKRTQQDKDSAVWKKLDFFQLTMNDAIKVLSRIEGKLEHNSNKE
nr:hypothetical protein BHI3_07720 [Bacteriovorax sp. HI3]